MIPRPDPARSPAQGCSRVEPQQSPCRKQAGSPGDQQQEQHRAGVGPRITFSHAVQHGLDQIGGWHGHDGTQAATRSRQDEPAHHDRPHRAARRGAKRQSDAELASDPTKVINNRCSVVAAARTVHTGGNQTGVPTMPWEICAAGRYTVGEVTISPGTMPSSMNPGRICTSATTPTISRSAPDNRMRRPIACHHRPLGDIARLKCPPGAHSDAKGRE